MIRNFYSRGKLLITGEYFVLNGSLAFAVPLKLGQEMSVQYLEDRGGELIWDTSIQNNPWFLAKYKLENLNLIDTTNKDQALFIQQLLLQLKDWSNVLTRTNGSMKISSNLEFPAKWGLGSSSSLISNLSYWANVDPYQLLSKTMQGSGFDIACARADQPVLYQLKNEPSVEDIRFEKDFLNSIYFIYSGRKQSSQQSIQKYASVIKDLKTERDRISALTRAVVESDSLDEFEHYMVEHEKIISGAIHVPTIQSTHFNDFEGVIKSLGAWGGDFIMATHSDSDYLVDYFKNKGFKTLFNYKQLVYGE